MKVIVNKKYYYQNGKELIFQHDIKNELPTTGSSKEETYFELKNVLNEFRTRDLWSSEEGVMEVELYFDDELVAVIQPCFTINGETYISRNEWPHCYLRNGNKTTIGKTTVTKHFYCAISEKEVRDILVRNFIDDFSWDNLQ